MKKNQIKILADLVVSRARVDRTEPDPNNLRAGWRTDQLLGDIEALLIGRGEPGDYAEIGRQALAQVRDLPEVTVLVQLAIFNGERRLPVSSKREGALIGMAKYLQQVVSFLPAGTRKIRCQSLFKYHCGVFYDAYGRSDLAAEAQGQSAQEAERLGDRSDMAIGQFMQALYRLKHMLYIGRSGSELEANFLRLEERFAELVEAVRGTAHEVQWAEGNGPVHMLEACIWLYRGDYLGWDDLVATALSATEKLGKAWEPIARFIGAVDLAKRGDPFADEALTAVAKSSDVGERRATALLVLVRRAMVNDDLKKAREFVDGMPETGARHVRAIAERLF